MAGIDETLGEWNNTLESGLKTMGRGLDPRGLVDWMVPKESEVLKQRDATFLAQTHRTIAVSNIGGGLFPTFDNKNLYGFAMLKFTGGWDSGWNVLDVKSVLKPDVVGSLTGGDDVANVSSYFFNVNPKSISLSEPNATHIIPTQNNGFYIESQGIVLRRLSISGTTGYRPSATKLAPSDLLPNNLNEPTGFLNHIKLRNLFRNYSDLKKDPKAAKNVYMVWYNGRTQEAWFCEPESFTSARDASSPFVSRYEIAVTVLHKIAFSAVSTKLSPGLMGKQFWLESLRLGAVLLNRENIPSWMKTMSNIGKAVSNTIGTIGKGIDIINQYATSAVNVGGMAVGTFMAVGVPILQSVKDTTFSMKSIVETGANIGISFAGGAESPFVKSWIDIGSDIQSSFISTIRSSNSLLRWGVNERGNRPSTNLARDNSYYADYGGKVNYEYPDDYTYIEGIVPDNIKDVESLLGNYPTNPASKPLFFAVNNLKYPYISNVPTGNTVKPGDKVYIPFPNGSIPANVETILFPLNIKLGLYEELLGRDVKLQSIETGMGQKSFNFAISDNGDLDLIEAKENMVQAIYIKLNVERGELPLHLGFGFIDVIGMKATLNLSFAANLAINDTMLSDGRIESVSELRIQISGDIMSVFLNAHIIGNNKIVPIGFSLGV